MLFPCKSFMFGNVADQETFIISFSISRVLSIPSWT
jgi:hypothetical protein